MAILEKTMNYLILFLHPSDGETEAQRDDDDLLKVTLPFSTSHTAIPLQVHNEFALIEKHS